MDFRRNRAQNNEFAAKPAQVTRAAPITPSAIPAIPVISVIPVISGGDDCLAALRAKRRIAAPSWVAPASLAENCRFLAGRVDEAGLLFFDAKSSLAYDDTDLPPELSLLPLDYHVHLPLDLPWHAPEAAAQICHALLARCAFLAGPGDGGARAGVRGVLHPPGASSGAAPGAARRRLAAFLGHFERLGGDASLLMLENTPDNDLTALADSIRGAGLGICLDLGHLLACGQEDALLRDAVMERVRMLHLSAPGVEAGRIRHLPLTALDGRGLATGRRLCREAPADAVLMVEVFSWPRFEESLPVLLSWLQPVAG